MSLFQESVSGLDLALVSSRFTIARSNPVKQGASLNTYYFLRSANLGNLVVLVVGEEIHEDVANHPDGYDQLDEPPG